MIEGASALTAAAVLQALERHIGAGNGIRGDLLVREILGDNDMTAERHLRQIVNDLRRDGHHICAHPKTGYYLAETAAELDDTCDFLYDRAMASLAQVAAMKRIALPDLRGQLNLPDLPPTGRGIE